jgi:hypothetical protein
MCQSSLRLPALAAAASLLAAPSVAQSNPWEIDLGPYRSVSVTWRGAGNIEAGGRVLGSGRTTGRALFAPAAMRMSLTIATTIQGASDSGTAWAVISGDTEAADNGTDTVTVEPSFRALLAREFAALAPAARAKVLANLRALGSVAEDELDAAPSAIGEKTGSATVAGQTCDVYTTGETSICVLPQAPAVMLRFRAGEGSYELVATEVRFNEPVPADAFAYPRGKAVQRLAAEDVMGERSWALEVYAEGNDGAEPPNLAALAKYVVRYLSTEDLGEAAREEPEDGI